MLPALPALPGKPHAHADASTESVFRTRCAHKLQAISGREARLVSCLLNLIAQRGNPISINEDRTIYEESLAFTLFAVCLRTNEYMSRRVSSLVIYAWVITKRLKTKKKSTKRDAWVRKDELEHPARHCEQLPKVRTGPASCRAQRSEFYAVVSSPSLVKFLYRSRHAVYVSR